MSKKAEELKIYSQQVFELRYEPYPDVLDKKGYLADLLSKTLKMPLWGIGNDRVDILSKDKKERCFISYKELGYALFNPDSPTHFQDRALKFLHTIRNSEISKFTSDPFKRLGVRSTYLIPYKGTFDELLEVYKKKYLNYSDENYKFFDGKLIDAGAPLNFKSNDGFFNTQCGPMVKEQYLMFFDKSLLENLEDMPDIALFFDIDYFKDEFNVTNWEEIDKLIKKYSQNSDEVCKAVNNLILN